MMIPIIEVLQVSKMHVFLTSEVFLRNVQRNSLTVEAFIELLISEQHKSYKIIEHKSKCKMRTH